MGRSGRALRWVLENYGISQSRLAKSMGITQVIVGQWFHELRDPSTEAIVEIITALRQIDGAAANEFSYLSTDTAYNNSKVRKILDSEEWSDS